MKESTRARVAAAVAAAAKGGKVNAVYDYSAAQYRNASADVRGGRVTGYDYSTSSHFSGGGSGKLDFYDYENAAHVQLKLEGDKFSGYDYHTQSHFSGTVRGSSISLYDYQVGGYFNFTA